MSKRWKYLLCGAAALVLLLILWRTGAVSALLIALGLIGSAAFGPDRRETDKRVDEMRKTIDTAEELKKTHEDEVKRIEKDTDSADITDLIRGANQRERDRSKP